MVSQADLEASGRRMTSHQAHSEKLSDNQRPVSKVFSKCWSPTFTTMCVFSPRCHVTTISARRFLFAVLNSRLSFLVIKNFPTRFNPFPKRLSANAPVFEVSRSQASQSDQSSSRDNRSGRKSRQSVRHLSPHRASSFKSQACCIRR